MKKAIKELIANIEAHPEEWERNPYSQRTIISNRKNGVTVYLSWLIARVFSNDHEVHMSNREWWQVREVTLRTIPMLTRDDPAVVLCEKLIGKERR